MGEAGEVGHGGSVVRGSRLTKGKCLIRQS